MIKILLLFLLLNIIFFSSPQKVLGYNLDDSGIQTVHQDYVPHVSSSGKVQYTYNQDSFFPLIIYPIDLGSVPDENGQPQGSQWKKWNLNDTTSRNTLPEVKKAGFNTAWLGDFPNRYELRLLNQYGIKIIPAVYTSWIYLYDRWQFAKDQLNSSKADPSVLGWYIFDERDDIDPTYGGRSNLFTIMPKIYAFIQSIDPTRFIFPNMSNSPKCDYDAFSDVFSTDFARPIDTNMNLDYILDGSMVFNCHSPQTGPKEPLFVTIQAFRHADKSPTMPTAVQIRAQIYTSIAAGATGLGFWYQHDPWQDPQSYGKPWREDTPDYLAFSGISPEVYADRWRLVSQTNHDIEKYKRIFFSKTSSSDEYHVYNEGGTVVTLLKDPSETGELNVRYLLSVNTENKNKKILFSLNKPYAPNATITSLFDARNITNVRSNFYDDFEGYGVRLYKIDLNQATPTPSPTPRSVIAGDLDKSGKVDIFDYNLLVAKFGNTACGNVADIDGNCKVDIFDYNILVGNFGKSG